jgi:hypothetical protein
LEKSYGAVKLKKKIAFEAESCEKGYVLVVSLFAPIIPGNESAPNAKPG